MSILFFLFISSNVRAVNMPSTQEWNSTSVRLIGLHEFEWEIEAVQQEWWTISPTVGVYNMSSLLKPITNFTSAYSPFQDILYMKWCSPPQWIPARDQVNRMEIVSETMQLKKKNTASSAGKEAVWMLEGLSLKNNETDLQINQCGFLGNLNTYKSDNWANSPAEDQKEPWSGVWF